MIQLHDVKKLHNILIKTFGRKCIPQFPKIQWFHRSQTCARKLSQYFHNLITPEGTRRVFTCYMILNISSHCLQRRMFYFSFFFLLFNLFWKKKGFFTTKVILSSAFQDQMNLPLAFREALDRWAEREQAQFSSYCNSMTDDWKQSQTLVMSPGLKIAEVPALLVFPRFFFILTETTS